MRLGGEMARVDELRSLLRLVDDENEVVREAVKRRLAAIGPSLEALLQEAGPDVAPEMLDHALDLQREFERESLLRAWERWSREASSVMKLESGHELVSRYLSFPDSQEVTIRDELDRLARAFVEEEPEGDFRDLAGFLFGSGRLAGASENYYHPQNSNLTRVLAEGYGNPISLASIYILVGARAGIQIGGCNYPAHFLARAVSPEDGELYLIDCFNEGKVIGADALVRHHPLSSQEVSDVVATPAPAELILARVIRNLENAFTREGEPEEVGFVQKLGAVLGDEFAAE